MKQCWGWPDWKIIYWSSSLKLDESLYARTRKIKAPWTAVLGDNMIKSIFYLIKSIKHFDFLDVPDAKVAVPPQKPAEGRITNHIPSTVLFYMCTEAAVQWKPQRKKVSSVGKI